MSELLPCPFCGKRMIRCGLDQSHWQQWWEHEDRHNGSTCPLKNQTISDSSDIYKAAWNTRTPSDAAHQVLTEMCETETRCRALLADYDKSSPDGIVPLDEVIALALSRSDAAVREWLPIETAPKDGTHVLLGRKLPWSSSSNVRIAYWAGEWQSDFPAWQSDGCSVDTKVYCYWMPLPAAPNTAAITATNKDSDV